MAYVCFTFALTAMLVLSQGVNAKRGCSAFGHSCFGGHGKRSDSSMDSTAGELLGRSQLGQEETPPHPGYHSGFILPSGDDIIPVRDGGAYDHEADESAAREVMKYKLRNIVKHWMEMYRRSQANDDGYVVENL